MKEQGLFILPMDGILVHYRIPSGILSGFPPTNCWFSFIHVGGRRHFEVVLSKNIM